MRLDRVWQRSLLFSILTVGSPLAADAAGMVQLYGVRMTPTGQDANRFGRPAWGGGLSAVVFLPPLNNLLAALGGFEVANMLSHTTETLDRVTGLRVEQQTSQDYVRIYLGPQIGPHGHGFFRPHVGANIALIIYDISTDIVVPDDTDPQKEIRQNLGSRTETAAGWDVTLGTDINFSSRFAVEGGVRFLKTFGVPQQLGVGTVRVEPAYFQIYLGVGFGFGAPDGNTDD